MVGFGLFAGLEDRLFLKIVLLGEYYEKELIELNNIWAQIVIFVAFWLCACFGSRPHPK
jgi:hypothetical protein